MATAQQRWEVLAQQVCSHRSAYYIGGASPVSDEEFDALVDALAAIEAEHPHLRSPDSPTMAVGAPTPRRAPVQRPPAAVGGGLGYAVIDVETTGFSPARERVVEVAAVHGITIEDVRDAPRFEHLAATLVELLAGRVIVAHNADFDLRFLGLELARAGVAMPEVVALCTMEASGDHLPHLGKRRLSDCCAAAGIDLTDADCAAGDTAATAALLAYYLTCPTGVRAARGYADLVTAAATLAWPPPPSGITRRPPAPRTSGQDRPTQAKPGRLATLLDRLPQVAPGAQPAEATDYRRVLAQAMADAVITDEEVDVLATKAAASGLTRQAVLGVHRSVLADLAATALEDGVLTRLQRAALLAQAGALALHDKDVVHAVDVAAAERTARLGAALSDLPEGWAQAPRCAWATAWPSPAGRAPAGRSWSARPPAPGCA